ncbi:unnamed protein product [Closterium sp. NIES-53]
MAGRGVQLQWLKQQDLPVSCAYYVLTILSAHGPPHPASPLPVLRQSAQLQWLKQQDLPVSCAQNDSSWYCASWDQCVSSDQLCDELADCNDESDELPWECGGYEEGCPPDMIVCPVTTISDKLWCIDPAAACDGSTDYPFGADEWPGFCVDFHGKATCSV